MVYCITNDPVLPSCARVLGGHRTLTRLAMAGAEDPAFEVDRYKSTADFAWGHNADAVPIAQPFVRPALALLRQS